MLLADRLNEPGRTLGPDYLTPLDFDDSLLGWWDASTLGLADSADVTTWPDLSGNGLDFTAQTADEPVFAARAYNGRGAVRFNDDADRHMDTATFTAISQPGSVLVVCESSSSNGYVIVDGQTSDRWVLGAGTAGSSNLTLWAGGASNAIPGASWPLSVLVGVFNTTDSTLWNVTAGTSRIGAIGSNTITGFRLGRHESTSTRRFEGDICEVAIWNRVVPPDEIGVLARDLAAKWGI